MSGWDDASWLDTNTVKGRWELVREALRGRELDATEVHTYESTETPQQAVARARAFWGDPDLTAETVDALTSFAVKAVTGVGPPRELRGWRQNALRHLLYFSPDLQTS